MNTTLTDRLILYVNSNPELNQNRIAKALKVHRTVINQWFEGRIEPSARLIIKFIEIFTDVDANWLIRGDNKEKQYKPVENVTDFVLLNESSKEVDYLREIIKFSCIADFQVISLIMQ